MMPFQDFAAKVAAKFTLMSASELFVVNLDEDLLYQRYLESFPEGTNPVFRKRTEHDCSCCRNFIKNLGNVVAIKDGKVTTVWDVTGLSHPYDAVAKSLKEYVLAFPILGIFRSKEIKYGNQMTFEQNPDGPVIKWNHFHGVVDRQHHTNSVGEVKGQFITTAAVFERGLKELTAESLQTVIELIESNSLYRGQEHLASVRAFAKLQAAYNKAADKNLFIWENIKNPATRFRNSVIGTLVTDLSADMSVEAAVRSFEVKVAPTNYKRPTSLITSGMVTQAMKTINELGLESALERRFADIGDVSINNVLWADREASQHMRVSAVESLLMKAVSKKTLKPSKVAETIGIADFLASVLPSAESLEVLFKNEHVNNLMSITAAKHDAAANIFKWNNKFAWSYNGNITDSIKERVKRAGGNVTNAKLRVSLGWYNFDDLDIHATDPAGHTIYFGNKAGVLDVDMNAGSGTTREPVENLSWKNIIDGEYKIFVNQFSKRETTNVGFELEVEHSGTVENFRYEKAVSGHINVLNITVKNKQVVSVIPKNGVIGGSNSKEIWGISTEQYLRVKTVMNSPNHWDGNAVGNKHWFFILDNCANDEPTRGIYNEFLDNKFDKHRKVFEVLGDKTKCPVVLDQLSGIGFSSTNSTQLSAIVTGQFGQKHYTIQF